MQEIETHPFSKYVNPCDGLKGGFIPHGTKMVIFGTHPPKNEYFGKGERFFYYSSHRNHLYVRVDNLFANELNYQSLKKQNTKTYMNLYLKTVSVKSHSLNHLELGLWMLSLGQAEEN